MPPLRLTSLLQDAFPGVSPTSRAVLSAIGCRNGHGPAASEIAAWVGLHDRHQLHRQLQRDGLPPLRHLTSWARVLYWMVEAERRGVSLLQLARREHTDVAVAYRLVRRVTGWRWSEAQRAGVTAALVRLRREFSSPGAGARVAPGPRLMGAPAATGGLPQARYSFRHPTGVLVERLVLGGSPFDVCFVADGSAVVTCLHAAALGGVSLQPLRQVWSLTTGAAPTMVVAGSRLAYVNNQFSEDISIVDLDERRAVGSIPTAGHPLAISLSPDGQVLYVATNRDRVHAIAVRSGREIAAATVDQTCQALRLHPGARHLYVPAWTAGVVLELDASTLAVTRRFETGGIAQDPVFSSDGLMMYVANQAGWLDAFHLPSGRRLGRLHFGTAAVHLALSPDEAVLYASLLFDGRVVEIDRERLCLTRSLPTGGKPRRIAFDRTGRSALIANEAGWIDLVR